MPDSMTVGATTEERKTTEPGSERSSAWSRRRGISTDFFSSSSSSLASSDAGSFLSRMGRAVGSGFGSSVRGVTPGAKTDGGTGVVSGGMAIVEWVDFRS